MPLWALAVAITPLAWLVPNHYAPWAAAWPDGLALLLVALALAIAGGRSALPGRWAAALAVAAASIGLQCAFGPILFGGDALMALLYLAAFAAALVLGTRLPALPPGRRYTPLDGLAVVTLAAAIVSVGIALVQWTGTLSLGIYAAELPRAARPFANVGQPNQFATLAFLGLCAVALLRESGLVGSTGFWAGASFMVLGIVMSASRAGWLELAAAVLLAALLQRRTASRVRLPQMLGIAALLAVLTLAWPAVNEALLLAAGRGVADQIDGGARLPLWRLLFDALGRQPLWGYGWQQMTLAQQAVSQDHPALIRLFEHSHNLLLDLLLWAGVPVGLTIILLAGAALAQPLRRLRDPRGLWLLAAVAGLLAHSMVEFPLEYAYFLIPFGLALGALHAMLPAARGLALPPLATRPAGAVLLLLVLAVAGEYIEAEENYRQLRFESARIGASAIGATTPPLHLLTQLHAFLAFARSEARPGMDDAQLAQMQHVSMRYAYPPAMFRYALAAGLNGRPDEARLTLVRLCRIHLPARCQEAHDNWRLLGERYPVLRSIDWR